MGWIIINVLIPVFAPLIALLPFYLFVHALPEKSRKLLRWTTPVKDGQMAWVSVAFNAVAAYDLYNAATPPSWKDGVLLGLIFLCVANVLIAALGGVFPVEDEVVAGESPWAHFPAMTASAVLTLLSAVLLAGVHFLA